MWARCRHQKDGYDAYCIYRKGHKGKHCHKSGDWWMRFVRTEK